MSPGKFNWFLHAMLFLQTQHVLKKQEEKLSSPDDDGSDSEVDVDVEL
jgi:hypothetical protein